MVGEQVDQAAPGDIAIAMVRDDAAAASVWLDSESGALAGLGGGATAVDCSTLSPDGARRLAAAAQDLGALVCRGSGCRIATLAESIGILDRQGIDIARALSIMAQTPVASPALNATGTAMVAGHNTPQFPIDLMDKDMAYCAALAGIDGAPMIAAVRQVLGKAQGALLGHLNFTALGRHYRRRRAAA